MEDKPHISCLSNDCWDGSGTSIKTGGGVGGFLGFFCCDDDELALLGDGGINNVSCACEIDDCCGIYSGAGVECGIFFFKILMTV